MDAAEATLEQLQTESRRVAEAAQAAGQFSAIRPEVASAVAQNVAALKTEAEGRNPENCGNAGEPEQQVRSDPGAGTTPPANAVSPNPGSAAEAQNRLVRDAAAELAAARMAADRCDIAALDTSIMRLDLIYVDATANFDWRGTTPEDWDAIKRDLEEARRLRRQCGDGEQSGTGFAPGFFAGLGVFTGGVGLPQTGTGFRRDGPPGEAPEVDAVLSEESVNILGVEGFFYIPGAGIPMRLGGHYREGDASNTFEILGDSGVDSGRVNGAPSPDGSSGVATGLGLGGGTEVEHRAYGARFDLGLYGGGAYSSAWFAQPGAIAGPQERVSLAAWVAYDHVDNDYSSFLDYSGGGPPFVFTFSQDRQQEVSEDYFSLGLTGDLAVPLGGGVSGHLTGSAGGYYRDTELESVERNLCNFCPPADQDFTIAIEESDSGFGFRGEAGVALDVRVSRSVSLYVAGSADYWSNVGAIFNPNSGDQVFFDGLTTALKTEDTWSWRMGGGIVILLGGR